MRPSSVSLFFCLAVALLPADGSLRAQSDLDAFMQQVLARRDDNWRKLQQYVLDEREQIELRGPTNRIWGAHREYTWYLRDGYFVRSPVSFNGVRIGETDRRQYENDFLRRAREADSRQSAVEAPTHTGTEAPQHPSTEAPASVDALIRQVREPQFVSSAYFLRFKFEAGNYALVGREVLDGREVLRIEYYPANLFTERQRRRMARDHNPQDPRDAEIQRMLNKVALVTLWIEPKDHQIVRYTFDNIGFDFLPFRWLVRLEALRSTMNMGQPFPTIWLPSNVEIAVAGDSAVGRFDVRYRVDYYGYRQADVATKIHLGSPR